MIGQPFVLIDNDRFTENQVWIIKKYSFIISKDDTSCNITGYSHSLDFFPEDLVISNTGIASVSALEIRDKVEQPQTWSIG